MVKLKNPSQDCKLYDIDSSHRVIFLYSLVRHLTSRDLVQWGWGKSSSFGMGQACILVTKSLKDAVFTQTDRQAGRQIGRWMFCFPYYVYICLLSVEMQFSLCI